MKRFWYRVHDRSVDTVAIWQTFAPEFMVGELTLAQHAAEVNLINLQHSQMSSAEQELGTARSARDTSYKRIAGLCPRACQVASGSLPAGHELRGTVSEVRRQRRESQEAVLGKGRQLVTAWQAVNAFRAALVAPLAPLTVGEVDSGAVSDIAPGASCVVAERE